MARKRKKDEKIKRDEVSPKEHLLLLQSSREQGKGQWSLKDFKLYQKLSVNESWRVDLEVGV
jgi:hypothetical protein